MTSVSESQQGSPVLVVLDRLWQTKIQGVAFLDQWSKVSKDAELTAGLKTHLEDERRHLRLIGEEIIQLGGRVASDRRDSVIGRAYDLARGQDGDLYKLTVCYRGVKLFTMRRCGQAASFLEPKTGKLLDRIASDEERHVRWSDIRIQRLMRPADMRQCNLLTDRVDKMLDSVWHKSWTELIRVGKARSS